MPAAPEQPHRDNGYTAEEFEADYAERSGVTVQYLREHDQVVRPCYCDYENCRGWQLVFKDTAALIDAGEIP